jgi:hypothetical protein
MASTGEFFHCAHSFLLPHYPHVRPQKLIPNFIELKFAHPSILLFILPAILINKLDENPSLYSALILKLNAYL